MKFRDYPNPYDFANPVTEENLFAGREEELKTIKYYLAQGRKVKKPINLSLIGERAAGKTSLLNMIEIEAKKIDYLTVRIDLDEGDKENQLSFFYKIFDSIFDAALEIGCFGGFNGAIHNEYLNQVSAFNISDDISLKPFVFPVQYAKAMELGRLNVLTSEANFKRDLDVIKQSVNKSIILLFDECNVLSESRILLEKIRNIFMNKENYMLVFTGTNELFPVIDDIFSPIIRQFKKINVVRFEEQDETESCVNKPLKSIGLDPYEVFESETYKELHNISEGKPYEIQLVCYNMFMKLQEGKFNKMTLNHNVLEDVRNELETSQDFRKRPRLLDIKLLNKNSLINLNYLCRSLGKCTKDEILDLEYNTNIETRVSRKELEESLIFFIDKEILVITEFGKIDFFGDAFDKLYTKFFARERNVDFEFNYESLHSNYYKSITKRLGFYYTLRDKISCSIKCIDSHESNQILSSLKYFYDENQPFNKNLNSYSLFKTYRSIYYFIDNPFSHIIYQLTINKIDLYIHFFTNNNEEIIKLKDYFKLFEERISPIENLDICLSHNLKLNKLNRDIIDFKIKNSNSDDLMYYIYNYHMLRYSFVYFSDLSHFSLQHSIYLLNSYDAIDPNIISESLFINLTYIFLINNRIELAEKSISLVKSDKLSQSSEALYYYNFSILNIMRKTSWTEKMKNSLDLSKGKNFTYDCILKPIFISKEEINYVEIRSDINLESIITEVLVSYNSFT